MDDFKDDVIEDIGIVEEALPEEDDVGRPNIQLGESEKPRVVRESIDVIAGEVYQKAGVLVRPLRVLDGLSITPITPDALDLLLNKRCVFQKWSRDRWADCSAPPWLAKQICNLQVWPNVRSLDSAASAPYLRPNKTVGGLQTGYDGPAKCWSFGGTRWLPVADAPTDEEAQKAIGVLKEVIDEFPFSNQSGLSTFLAAVLTIVARRAIQGLVPMILIDASTPGSGKTLLAKIIVLIATGKLPGIASAGSKGDELRKAITSFLMNGEQAIVFDNCSGPFGGETIDRFITAEIWSDRLLQINKIVSLPNQSLVIVTSNNAHVAGDTARRSLLIALRPNCERPEERTFRNPHLIQFVKTRQQALTHAALTILRWHIAKGEPEYKTSIHIDGEGNSHRIPVKPYGGFESWSRLVRHAIIGLGLPDPVQTAEGIRQVDETALLRRAFLESLAAYDFHWEGTCNDLVSGLYKDKPVTQEQRDLRAAIENLVGEKDIKNGVPSAKALGYRFREFKGRYYSDLALEWVRSRADGSVFRLVVRKEGE